MPRPAPTVLAIAIVSAACDDTMVSIPRGDSGVATPDSGIIGELPLKKGWTFTYSGILTRRMGAEKQSKYELTLKIEDVTDNGAAADSTVKVSATGGNTLHDDWDVTAGADSWVARVGPSEQNDSVSPGAAELTLDDSLEEPAGPMLPKRLPKPDLFFVDVRRMDDVLANWSQAWAALAPTAASPATSGTGFWVLSIRGTDPSLTYYSSPRAVSISYDPRGFLRSISEDLGDPNDMTEPRGSFRLTLDSTPPE